MSDNLHHSKGQQLPPGSGGMQVGAAMRTTSLLPQEQALYRALAERARKLQKALLAMNGGREYPDSTPLIREMRDDPSV